MEATSLDNPNKLQPSREGPWAHSVCGWVGDVFV